MAPSTETGRKELPKFDIRKHLDELTPDGGSTTKTQNSYHCPVCNSSNFKVHISGTKAGTYQTWGCDCAKSAAGKQKIKDAIAPLKSEKPIREASNITYTYKEFTGTDWIDVAQVRRSDDGKGKRKFLQWHHDGTKWVCGLPSEIHSRIHLYRIESPINQAAIDQGGEILIVEGEGKVNRLLLMKIPATCSIGGAGKWRNYGYPNYLKDLGQARPVICPDRDLPGIKHGDDIAIDYPDSRWLYPSPTSYLWNRLIQANKGFDIADWIDDDGATREDILAAIGDRRDLILSIPEPEPEPTSERAPMMTGTITIGDSGGDDGDDDEKSRMLREYDRIRNRFGDKFRWNELFKQVEFEGDKFAIGLAKPFFNIKQRMNLKSGRDDIADIILMYAKEYSYNPVTEYLDRCFIRHGANTDILKGMAKRYLGADLPIHQILLIKWLISCVARAYKPGCQCDNALILQGAQGWRKSTFFRVLAGNAWFDDTMGNSGDKDERLKLHRAWIIEWAELEAIFKKKDMAVVKAFMTTKTDILRPPYGRDIEALDRPSVFCGTTNQKEFLNDSTGNRRFWVIPLGMQIDTTLLQGERDQIWGAVIRLYRDGCEWHLTPEEDATLNEQRSQFESSDSWDEEIADFIEGKEKIAIWEILDELFKLPIAQHERKTQNRVRDCLYKLNWTPIPKTIWHKGKASKVWNKIL